MLRFNSYLTEAKKNKDGSDSKAGAVANTNGVRHELLMAGILNHMSAHYKNSNAYNGENADLFNMNEDELRKHFDKHVRPSDGTTPWQDKYMPKHFRAEAGQTPKEVHSRYTHDSLDPEEHFQHWRNAVHHAKELHKHLKERGYDPTSISNVAWSSVEGNVNSFMKEHGNNPNRTPNPETDDADLMATIKDKDGNEVPLAMSLKWGSKKGKPPTAKNNTHRTVVSLKEFGRGHSDAVADAIKEYHENAQKAVDEHKNLLKKIYPKGGSDETRKAIYDTDKEAAKQNPNDERAVNNIKAVEDSYTNKSEAVAGHLHNMLHKINNSENGHEAIKHFIRSKLQIPNPDFVAARSHMTVDANNHDNGHHFEDHSTSLNDHLNNAHHFHIERNGSTINIHAIDKDGNKLFTHKLWTKHNSRKSDASTKWLHSVSIPNLNENTIEENMSLLNLVENIISGKLNESQGSFKSVLGEKVLQKIEEKKLSKKQKQLDKNHNGKLDSDDFQKLRGGKGCDSGCNESVEVIKSNNGKKIGEIYQHDGGWGCLHYKSDQGSTHNDTREDALQTLKDLHNQFKEELSIEELESQLAEVLNPSMGVKAYIDDFIKSGNPKFKGKSKEQRRKMAIAAFYSAKQK